MVPVLTPASEILNLFHALDSQNGLERKMHVLEHWIRVIPEIDEFRLFDRRSPVDGFSEEDFLFAEDGPVALTLSSSGPPFVQRHEDWSRGTLVYPLPRRAGKVPGLFLIRTSNPMKVLQERNTTLAIVASKFRDILAIEAPVERVFGPLVQAPEAEQAFSYLSAGNESHRRQLLESLKLPYYVVHLSGKFSYFNAPFAHLFGYASVEELNRREPGFFDASERSKELAILTKSGSTMGYPLNVQHASGRMLQIRDYAVLHDGFVLGILFDVTDYVTLNEEMKESLRIQQLLNDKIINSAMILEKTQTTSIRALARLAEYRDHETGGHLQRICEYTRILVKELYRRQPFEAPISDQFAQDIVLSSMLHDIGKVAVPDAILRKRDNLTEEERAVMRRHTEWGWQIIHQADMELGEESFLTLAGQIALCHHEKWDGSGYPRGLRGTEIPVSARIEALSDVYDALTSVRSYKNAWSHEEAVEEITRLRGLQFDPVLVDIFLDIHEQFREIKSLYSNWEEHP